MTWVEWSRIAFFFLTAFVMPLVLNAIADVYWYERDGKPGTISHAMAVWACTSQLVAPLFVSLTIGFWSGLDFHFFVGRVTGR